MDVSKLLQYILIFILIFLLTGWLGRTVSYKAKTEHKDKVLRYDRSMKMIGVVSVIFWASLIVIMLTTSKQDIFWPLMIFLGFGIISLWLTIEAFFVKISYDDTCITASSPWRGTRNILWEEIESASYNSTLQWYVCHTKNKGDLRLSPYLSGLAEFMNELRGRLSVRASMENRRRSD